jgi:hypothetical protein
MSHRVKEENQKPNVDWEKSRFLWDEYKYRHELCWKLIFQTTAAVVIILIIPYTKTEIAKGVGGWIVALPAIAIALSLFSRMRLSRELEILDKVRNKHRDLQKENYGIQYEESGSKFSRDVKCYLGCLAIVGVVDIIAIICIWIPYLRY